MKTKKKINSIFTYILAGLLCLIVMLIPVFSYNGGIATPNGNKTAAADGEANVTLEWNTAKDSGTVVDSNGVARSTYLGSNSKKQTIKATLTLHNPQVEKEVKVHVVTHDVSAKARADSVGDYDAIDTTYILTAQNPTREITISIYPQYNYSKKTLDLAINKRRTFAKGESYDLVTKVFGLRIQSVENAVVNHSKNSLLAQVLCDTSQIVDAVQNGALIYYHGDFSLGWSYNATAVEYTRSIEDFQSKSVSGKKTTQTTLPNPSTWIPNAQLTTLRNFYNSELSYYYRVNGGVKTDADLPLGTTFKIWDGTGTLYEDEWAEPQKGDIGSGYEFPLEGNGTSEGVSHNSRSSSIYATKYLKYNGSDVTFWFKNRSCAKRTLYGWRYQMIIDSNTMPKITGYRMDTAAYGYGDELYLAVDFNKQVQVNIPKGSTFQVRGYIGNSEVLFDYAGGSLTSTLYFKASLDAVEYNATTVSISAFEGVGVKISDMFMNGNNINNTLNLSDLPRGSKANPLERFNTTVDTRSPDVETNYTNTSTQKSHTVPVKVSSITPGATMETCWADFPEASSVSDWKLETINIDDKDDNETTCYITGSGYTGIRYLHVRVTSATGRQTVKTFGPYKFDNSAPEIKTIPGENDNVYQKQHTVSVYIYNGEKSLNTYIAKVYLYAKNTSNNILLEKKLVYDRDASSNLLTNDESENVYTMNVDTVLIGMKADTYGDYQLGFTAEDTLGNTQEGAVYSEKATAFDNRDTFQATVKMDADDKDFTFDGQNIFIMSGASRTVSLSTASAQNNSLSVLSIKKNGTLIYNDTKGTYGTTASPDAMLEGYSTSNISNWKVSSSGTEYTAKVTFTKDAEGYYDIILISNKQRQSQVIRLFFSQEEGVSNPDNYATLYAEDRLLINEVWRFTTNYFYKYGAEPEKYVNVTPDKNPIFSSKDKALEYAKFKEYQDLTPIVLEPSQAQQLEAGTNSAFMKANIPENQSMTAMAGQIWIRYKSTNWKVGSTSSNSTSSWVYYYYGGGSGVEAGTRPIIDTLPTYLEEAITINAKKICGYDGEPYYLTYNNGHQATGETLTYEKEAIFFDELTYTDGFAKPVKYSGDPAIYDNTVKVDVNGKAQEVSYFSTHDVYFEGGYGALYYRLLGAETWSIAYNNDRLQDRFTTTGVYEFVEMGKGYKHYYLYVDKNEPILSYDFTHQNSEESTVSYLDKNIEGSVFNAKSVTLKGILYGSNGVSGYTSEVDEYAYICVMNSNSTVLLKFLTMKQLHDMSDGYPLASGTYQIYVYDRLGNSTYMTVRVNDDALSVVEQIRENNSITFYFNRRLTEIREETFEIYRDGAKLDVAYAETLTFKESGVYRIKLTDIYGYSIDQDFEFTRDYPELKFYYIQNGRYQEVPVVDETAENGESEVAPTNQAVKVIKKTDNSYLVICAEDIRITYSNDTDYIVRTVSGNPTVKQSGLNSVTLDISGGAEDWGIQIAYEDDPLVYLSVICSYDMDAPVISAESETINYSYNDSNGGNNVLFRADGMKTVTVENGSRLNTTSITMNWSDENELRRVYYVKHGEESVVEIEDPNEGTCVIEGVGEYTFYAVDLIGNAAEFSFTLAETVNLTYMIGDKEIAFSPNPLDHIDGDVYSESETQYTGEAVRFICNNFGSAAFLWSNGEESYIYYILYSPDGIFIVYLQDGEEIVVNTTEELIASGVLVEEPFRLCYGMSAEGRYLEIPAPQTEYAFWQFRISDAMGVSPVIAQFVQSNVLPEVELKEADNDTVEANATDFVGVNSAVSVVSESITDQIESVVAYRNDTYSMDFSHAQEYVLYEKKEKTYGSISDYGYYKIVATNIYGNQQVMYVRLSFELDINVLVEYTDGEQRTYTLGREKEQIFRSNKLVAFSVWDAECEISIEKNGSTYQPDIEYRTGYFYFKLDEYGEYVMTAIDSCGNLYTLNISLKAPEMVEYNGYLTDFNEDALYKDRFYSNAPISIDRAAIENSKIGCVGYRYVDGNGKKAPTVVLYDAIAQDAIGYSEENFLRSIGKEGDGAYEVTFSDIYGNKLTVTVKISTAEQLAITRTTQNGTRADAWTVADALEIGVWSNRLVTLTDNAAASLLKVDGETVEFVNGKYVLEYPSMTTVEDVQRQVVYIDEYGNKYEFTVHLYRKTPEVTFESEKQLVVIANNAYVQGAFAYAWTDTKVTATYSVDMSEAKPYYSGTLLTEDAYYAFTFTDIAGNEATRTATIDTRVSYTLKNGGTTVLPGVTVNGTVSLYENGDTLTVVSVEKDGETLKTDAQSFNEHGSYKLVIRDVLGNLETLEFTIYNHAMNSFAYTANENYSIIQVWYHREEGLQSYVSDVVMDETQTRHVYEFKIEGLYEIELYNHDVGEVFTFEVTIDDTPPAVAIVGAEQGESTRKNVTFEGLQVGDVVKIYDGKKLVQTFTVEADGQSPKIEKAGNYRVVITDAAGNTTEYTFTREFTTNVASNILIILLLSLTVAGGFIYIVLREKNKVK